MVYRKIKCVYFLLHYEQNNKEQIPTMEKIKCVYFLLHYEQNNNNEQIPTMENLSEYLDLQPYCFCRVVVTIILIDFFICLSIMYYSVTSRNGHLSEMKTSPKWMHFGATVSPIQITV